MALEGLPALKDSRRRSWILFALIAGLILIGFIVARWRRRRVESALREKGQSLWPDLSQIQGLTEALPTRLMARLAQDVGPTGPRTHYMRAVLKDGVVTPFAEQDSSLLRVLSEANVLLERPLGDRPRKAGEEVPVLPL